MSDQTLSMAKNSMSGSTLMRQPTGYHDLPNDILVKIFSFFSEKEIASDLSKVCRNWYRATRHPSLLKHLEFFGNKMTTSAICQKLHFAPQLESVEFTSVPDIITLIRQVCRCNVEVKNVALKYCTDNEKDEVIPQTVLRNLITSCQQLQSLNLKGTQFHAFRFVQDLIRLPYLRSLDLSQNRLLRVKDLVALSINCRELEELKVSWLQPLENQPSLTDEDACFIFANLHDTLLSLKFDVRGLGPATFQAILKCSKLQELSLNNALLLPSDQFRSIAHFLRDIRVLKVSNASQLTSDDFFYLFKQNVKIMKKVISLDFSGCWKLGDDGLIAVADVCGDNLEHLILRCCKSLTSVSLEHVLMQCHKLRHLDIAYVVNLQTHSLNYIQTHMPCLQALVIDDDICKEDILLGLKAKMPTLHITRSISECSRSKTEFP